MVTAVRLEGRGKASIREPGHLRRPKQYHEDGHDRFNIFRPSGAADGAARRHRTSRSGDDRCRLLVERHQLRRHRSAGDQRRVGIDVLPADHPELWSRGHDRRAAAAGCLAQPGVDGDPAVTGPGRSYGRDRDLDRPRAREPRGREREGPAPCRQQSVLRGGARYRTRLRVGVVRRHSRRGGCRVT